MEQTQFKTAPLWNIVPTAGSVVRAKDMPATAKNIQIIMNIALEACEAIEQRQMTGFDALVMECCCQIRAEMFAYFANSVDIALEVQYTKSVIAEAKEKIAHVKSPSKPCAFTDVMQEQQISLDIPEKIHALVAAYILTMTKITPPPHKYEAGDITDLKALVKSGFSKNFANNVNKTARKILSEYSVNFVQECAAKLPPTEKIKMLQDHVSTPVVDDSGVQSLSCFALSDVMYRSALQNNIPAVLIVDRHITGHPEPMDRVKLFYKPTPEGYQLASAEEFTPGTAAWVMEAYNFSEEPPEPSKFQVKLKDAYYAMMAQHAQYAVQYKNAETPDDPRLEKYQAIAQNEGYCRENPSKCVMVHIFCDTIENYAGAGA
ncbi:MAG: hypothetical protein Q8K75_10420 [Chlamydiales bacterium]|nr:hypothetical protein [Chlamydiales bacterium]